MYSPIKQLYENSRDARTILCNLIGTADTTEKQAALEVALKTFTDWDKARKNLDDAFHDSSET